MPQPGEVGGGGGGDNGKEKKKELRFCNASGRMGTVTICQISGDFLRGCNTSHDSRTRPQQTRASPSVIVAIT